MFNNNSAFLRYIRFPYSEAFVRLSVFAGLLLLFYVPGLHAATISTHEQEVITIKRGRSIIVDFDENIQTLAQGRSGRFGIVVLTPRRIILNGQSPGATSLTVISESKEITHYLVQVVHDLDLLEEYLKRLDDRIEIVPDTNGDGILLTGTVSSRDVIMKAMEATVRFVGNTSISLGTTPPQTIDVPNARVGQNGLGADNIDQQLIDEINGEIEAEVITNDSGFGNSDVDVVVGTGAQTNIYTENITTGSTRIVNLLVAEDELPPAPRRLEKLLAEIHPDITVSQVNSVFILKGTVDTAAEHVRALVLADRFVGGNGEFDFTVISDKGGVLAGDLTEADEDQLLDQATQLNVPQVPLIGGFGGGGGGGIGGGGGGRGGGGRGGRGGSSITLSTTEIDPKGNLGQNVQRADVITVAGGRVVSMIKVSKQPRVEVQMHIVSIDKDKSRELGVDFDVIAENGEIAFSTVTGGFAGTANVLFDFIDDDPDGITSISSFIRALERKGAAKTLAEPTLTTVSGEAATFLVGGNLPIPSGTNTITTNGVVNTVQRAVTFIEFGLRLIIRPTVLDSGKIAMVLDQELIEPDEASGIVFQGANVPGFTQRSVRTVTESYNDETWAVAGLISQENIKSLSKVPFLSDIPILGELFKIRNNQEVNNELIITVSARELQEGIYGQETLQDKMRQNLPGYERKEVETELHIELTDFASEQMNLPPAERLAVNGIEPVEISMHPVRIIYDQNIKTRPLAAWKKDNHYVTVVQFVNISDQPKKINPEQLKGKWVSIGLDNDELSAKGTDDSSTMAYLVSDQPFFNVLNSVNNISAGDL